MPIVQRAEDDYFRLSPIVDFMVNPANTIGAAGAGISKEFRDRYPAFYDTYRNACVSGKFKIGSLFTWRDIKSMNYAIMTVATKDHWMDKSEISYVRKALIAMREYLQAGDTGPRSLHTLAMPMLGAGNGQLPVDEVLPMIYDYLDDLDNVIHLCRRPSDLGRIPKYLAIIGPRRLRPKDSLPNKKGWEIEEDRAYVEAHVNKALENWGLKWEDFDAVVSGGADGVDSIACGSDRKHHSYEYSLAKKYHQAPPVICKADWDRFGRSAGMIRNRTVMDIATHIVAVFHPSVVSIGTPMALKLATTMNEGLQNKKAIQVFGDDRYSSFTNDFHPKYDGVNRYTSKDIVYRS